MDNAWERDLRDESSSGSSQPKKRGKAEACEWRGRNGCVVRWGAPNLESEGEQLVLAATPPKR